MKAHIARFFESPKNNIKKEDILNKIISLTENIVVNNKYPTLNFYYFTTPNLLEKIL